MRILLDCRMADWSGVGRYTTGLARGLAARDDVELVQLVGRGQLPPVTDGAQVFSVGGSPLLPMSALGFSRIARDVEPDVVHATHFPTPMPLVHPLVVTLHDVGPLVDRRVMPSRLRRSVYKRLNDRAVRLADRIVVPSAFSSAEIQRVLGAPSDRIRITPEAADDFTAGAMGELPTDFASWLGDAPFILSMGNTKPHKDLPTLLAAFQQLVGSRNGTAGIPDGVRLVLAGREVPGYLAGWLTERAASVRACFSGPISDEHLRALYSRASVFAFPSRYEGFGLPPLEAMALGAPVVASDAASLPEVVGDAALLVQPGDVDALAQALSRVLSSPALASDLATRGRARAALFSWARTASATVDVYREVAQRD